MNVAIIFGGESCEHDISIITGIQLIKNMNEYLYNIVPIYIDKNGRWLTSKNFNDLDNINNEIKKAKLCSFVANDQNLYIGGGTKYKKNLKIDVAILCLHGVGCEDGTVAAVLEMSKIPYTSAEICASSVCMDKCVFKMFAKGLGVNVVPGISVSEDKYLLDREEILNLIQELGYPVIVKPSRLGSSIGIEVCQSENNIDSCLKNAFKYDKKVMIEKYLKIDKEVNIAVVEDKSDLILSNTEEPVFKNELLSFDDKYLKSVGGFETIKRIVPARLDKFQFDEVSQIATSLYVALEMFGVVRFDFLISEGVVYLNEVNTIPGSMANYLFDKEKLNYGKLLEILISNAIFRRERKNMLITSYNTDVLNSGEIGLKK